MKNGIQHNIFNKAINAKIGADFKLQNLVDL